MLTVLDDYSCYIISWELCSMMRTSDVTAMLNMSLEATGCDQVNVVHKPRMLSNGASYISGELAEYINDKGMSHVRGAKYNPQSPGKIETWHQTLKKTESCWKITSYPATWSGKLKASLYIITSAKTIA